MRKAGFVDIYAGKYGEFARHRHSPHSCAQQREETTNQPTNDNATQLPFKYYLTSITNSTSLKKKKKKSAKFLPFLQNFISSEGLKIKQMNEGMALLLF